MVLLSKIDGQLRKWCWWQGRCRRRDVLAAQKINVGIVFHNMLSAEEANHYMAKNGIPEAVATRVLDHARHRRKNDVHPRLVDQPHGDNGG